MENLERICIAAKEAEAFELATVMFEIIITKSQDLYSLRWLDTVFQGQYLPSLSVNYVAINKDLEKLTPQLY